MGFKYPVVLACCPTVLQPQTMFIMIIPYDNKLSMIIVILVVKHYHHDTYIMMIP